MLGSGPGRGRHEWYPGFYLQRRRLGCRMNRAEQENIYRQSRQLTTIVPSHEDLVLSVLKSPISQHQHQHQHQQRQQHHPTHHSHGHHVNCQGHQNHKKCTHSGILGLAEETQFVLNGVTIGRFLAAHWNYRNTAGFRWFLLFCFVVTISCTKMLLLGCFDTWFSTNIVDFNRVFSFCG